jgi:hypothetical protein
MSPGGQHGTLGELTKRHCKIVQRAVEVLLNCRHLATRRPRRNPSKDPRSRVGQPRLSSLNDGPPPPSSVNNGPAPTFFCKRWASPTLRSRENSAVDDGEMIAERHGIKVKM